MANNLFGPPLATAPIVVGAAAAGASRRDAVWEAKRAARLQGAFPGPAAMEAHAAPTAFNWQGSSGGSSDGLAGAFTPFVPPPAVLPAARSPLHLAPEPSYPHPAHPVAEPEPPSFTFGRHMQPAPYSFSHQSSAPQQQDDFAFAREVASGGAAPSHHSGGDGLFAALAAPTGRGGRPAKEQYAAELERQVEHKRAMAVATREQEKADAARMHAEMHRALPVREDTDVFGRARSKSPGRGPLSPRGVAPAVSSYADALEQQIAAKAEAARREKAADRRAANAAMGLADVLVTSNEQRGREPARPLVPHAARDRDDDFSYVLGRRPQPASDVFNRPASAADGVAVSHMNGGAATDGPPYVRRVSSASILGAAAARVVADAGGSMGALGGIGERERAGRQRAVKESYADELRRQMAEQENSKRRSRMADLSPQYVPPSRHAARAGGSSPVRAMEDPGKWAYAGSAATSAASPRAHVAAPPPAPAAPSMFMPQQFMQQAPPQQMGMPMSFQPQMQQQQQGGGGAYGYPAPQMIAIPVPYPVPMPSHGMPQFGGGGGMYGAPMQPPQMQHFQPPPPAPSAFLPHLPLESEQGGAPSYMFGGADDAPAAASVAAGRGGGDSKDSKAKYAAALEEQIAQGQARKMSEKARLAADDVRLEREIAAHEARVAARKMQGGAGDPARDDMGHIIAVRGNRKSGAPGGGLASGGDSPYGVVPVSPPGDPRTARFWPDGNGSGDQRPHLNLAGRTSPTLDPAELRARQLAENAAALEAQIADKAARKRKEAADHAAMEAAEEARIARERAEIERKFQEEERIAREKLEAERRSVLDAQIAGKKLSKDVESRKEKEEEARFDAKIKRQQAEMAAAFEAEQRRAAGLPPLPTSAPESPASIAALSPTQASLALAAPIERPVAMQLFAPASPGRSMAFPPAAAQQQEPSMLLRKHEEDIALLRAEMAALHVRASDAAFMSGLERVGLAHPTAPPPPVYSGIPSMSDDMSGPALGLSAPPIQSLRAGFAHEGAAGAAAPMPVASASQQKGTHAGVMDDSAFVDASPMNISGGRASPVPSVGRMDTSLPSGSSMQGSMQAHKEDVAGPQHAESPVLPRKILSRVPSSSQQELLLASMHGESLFIVPGAGFEAGGQAFGSTLQRLAAVMETEEERAADTGAAATRQPSPPPGMTVQPHTANSMQVADAVHRALTQPSVVDSELGAGRRAPASRPASSGADDIIRAIDGILSEPDGTVLASSLVAGENNAFMQASMEDSMLNESYAPPEFMRVSAALPRQHQQQHQQRAPVREPQASVQAHAPPPVLEEEEDRFEAGEDTMDLLAIQRRTDARMRALDGAAYGYARPVSQASRTSATPADLHPSAWVRNIMDQHTQHHLPPPPPATKPMMRWREGVESPIPPTHRSPLTVPVDASYAHEASYGGGATRSSSPTSSEERSARGRGRQERRRDRTASPSSHDSDRERRRDVRHRDERPRDRDDHPRDDGRRRQEGRSRSRHRSQSRPPPRRGQQQREDEDADCNSSDWSDGYSSSRGRGDRRRGDRERERPRRDDERGQQPRRGGRDMPTSDSDMNPVGPDERGRRERGGGRARSRSRMRDRSRSASSEDRGQRQRRRSNRNERDREDAPQGRPPRGSVPRARDTVREAAAAPAPAASLRAPHMAASPLVLPDEPFVLQASMPVFPLPQGGSVYAQSARGDRSHMLDGPSEYLRMR